MQAPGTVPSTPLTQGSQLQRCPRAVGDGLHRTGRKAHRCGEIAGTTAVQPFIDRQAGNDRACKQLRHLLESGGIVDRRTEGILKQRLPAVVEDTQPRVPGFNDVAIATQRFQVRGQAPGKTPATRQMRTGDFTFATFAPSCCETKYLSTDLTHSAYCFSMKSRLGKFFSSLDSA